MNIKEILKVRVHSLELENHGILEQLKNLKETVFFTDPVRGHELGHLMRPIFMSIGWEEDKYLFHYVRAFELVSQHGFRSHKIFNISQEELWENEEYRNAKHYLDLITEFVIYNPNTPIQWGLINTLADYMVQILTVERFEQDILSKYFSLDENDDYLEESEDDGDYPEFE